MTGETGSQRGEGLSTQQLSAAWRSRVIPAPGLGDVAGTGPPEIQSPPEILTGVSREGRTTRACRMFLFHSPSIVSHLLNSAKIS